MNNCCICQFNENYISCKKCKIYTLCLECYDVLNRYRNVVYNINFDRVCFDCNRKLI